MSKTKIISITNNKGGVGKTTCNILMACYLREKGYKVLGVDFEFPGYFSRFFNQQTSLADDPAIMSLFAAKGVKPPVVVDEKMSLYQTYDELANVDSMGIESIYNFKHNLAEVAADFDYVVIDTPPLLNNRLDCALAVCTHVIAVLQPADFSLDALGSFLGRYTQTRRNLNPLLPKLPYCFFNMVMGVNPKHKANVDDFFEQYQSGFFSTNFLRMRKDVSESISAFKPVWKYASKKHIKDEVLAVFDDVYAFVGGK